MINRAAIMLRYKEPAIRWINESDPDEDDPGITIEEVNQERTVYLVSDKDGDTDKTVARWVKKNYLELFEAELESWYLDMDLWPEKLTLKLFKEWFDIECHTMLKDTVGTRIYDEEI